MRGGEGRRASGASGAELEDDLQAELDLSLAERAAHFAEVRGVERGARIVEVRRVGEIEGLGPQLHVPALGEPELLDDRQVEVDVAGSAQGVSPGVAERGGSWDGKGGRVEPLPPRPDVAEDRRRRVDVRPLVVARRVQSGAAVAE